MEKVTEYKVTVRQFLTKPSNNPRFQDKKPVPLRTMFGYIHQETQNQVYMKLRGKAEPSSYCYVCGRELTHPVSLLYGIGPECGEHWHETSMPKADVDAWYESLREKMRDVTWEGWLPRGYIEYHATGEEIEPFLNTEEVIKPLKPLKPKGQPVSKVNQELVESLAAELGL